MSALSEKLKKLAELNFCEDCYSKYLDLIHGEIEYLLSEPISDWRQTENNINVLWIKAKGLYDVKKSLMFSPHQNAFKKAREESVKKKLDDLKEKGIIKEYTHNFLQAVRRRRNKVHPPSTFSKQDYILFREAKALTDALFPVIIFDLKDPWKKQLDYVEKRAKWLLEKTELF